MNNQTNSNLIKSSKNIFYLKPQTYCRHSPSTRRFFPHCNILSILRYVLLYSVQDTVDTFTSFVFLIEEGIEANASATRLSKLTRLSEGGGGL